MGVTYPRKFLITPVSIHKTVGMSHGGKTSVFESCPRTLEGQGLNPQINTVVTKRVSRAPETTLLQVELTGTRTNSGPRLAGAEGGMSVRALSLLAFASCTPLRDLIPFL